MLLLQSSTLQRHSLWLQSSQVYPVVDARTKLILPISGAYFMRNVFKSYCYRNAVHSVARPDPKQTKTYYQYVQKNARLGMYAAQNDAG